MNERRPNEAARGSVGTVRSMGQDVWRVSGLQWGVGDRCLPTLRGTADARFARCYLPKPSDLLRGEQP